MKGLPLAYNKDMQEDKEAVFDAVDTVKDCLGIFAPMVATMTRDKRRTCSPPPRRALSTPPTWRTIW